MFGSRSQQYYLTKMRSIPLIRCLPKMSPSSSTSTGSQIATWRRSLTWTRHDFSSNLRSPSTGKMFVWSVITGVSLTVSDAFYIGHSNGFVTYLLNNESTTIFRFKLFVNLCCHCCVSGGKKFGLIAWINIKQYGNFWMWSGHSSCTLAADTLHFMGTVGNNGVIICVNEP